MATASVTYSFTASTTAVSAQVNQDFTDLVTFLNNQVVQVDGSKAMTAPLSLAASDPVSANQAARKAYVDTKALYKGATSTATTQAFVGALQATDTQLLVKSAEWVGVTSATGQVDLAFSAAFPTSVNCVQCTIANGALHNNGTALVTTSPAFLFVTNVTLAGFSVRIFQPGGGGANALSTAFSWVALGN